eukprot:SAG11_NODE_17024_length_530_cov_1.958237_1_plen_127_part_10
MTNDAYYVSDGDFGEELAREFEVEEEAENEGAPGTTQELVERPGATPRQSPEEEEENEGEEAHVNEEEEQRFDFGSTSDGLTSAQIGDGTTDWLNDSLLAAATAAAAPAAAAPEAAAPAAAASAAAA